MLLDTIGYKELIKTGQVKQNLHASPTRVTILIRFLYTITLTGQVRITLLYAQAQTRREWVESIVRAARISCAFFATYFSMPISIF